MSSDWSGVLKPINHGTEAGYKMHRRRGIPVCDDCRQALRAVSNDRARDRYWRNPEAQRARKRAEYWDLANRRPPKLSETIVDYLTTLEMEWGAGVPMAVLVDRITDRHDVKPETIKRAVYRMMDSGRVGSYQRGSDDWRYRLNEPDPR